MADVNLRALRVEDLDRVSEIESGVSGTNRKAFFEKHVSLVTADPDNFITSAAEIDGRLVGYAIARITAGEFGARDTFAVLELIAVEKGWQGKGIGTTVLSRIEQKLRDSGLATLKTQVKWTNHSLTNFFGSSGFLLDSNQIIERETSPLPEKTGKTGLPGMDSRWEARRAARVKDAMEPGQERIVIRSLRKEDLPGIVRIDNKYTGQDRSSYFDAKAREIFDESGVRVSVVAEEHGVVVGFIMARVNFGEYGRVEREAVIDTIAVHPAYRGSGVGHLLLSQLLRNLSTLQVESVRVQIRWENFNLQKFLHERGFKPSQRLVLIKTLTV